MSYGRRTGHPPHRPGIDHAETLIVAGGGDGTPWDYEALDTDWLWTADEVTQGQALTKCGKTPARRNQLLEGFPGDISASFVSFAACCVTALLLG
jgi:hypothetical protein